MLPSLVLLVLLYSSEAVRQGEFVSYIQAPPIVHQFVNYMPDSSPIIASAPPIRECGMTAQERVRQCADPLYRVGILTGAEGALSWQHFLSRTREYFSEVCDNFFVFDLCIEPYKDACFGSPGSRFRYDAALKVLDFLCRDGYGEMMRNFECFTRTLTRAEMMQCQAEMVADTRKIPHGGETETQTQQAAACGAMRNYVDCVRYPIRYECGYRAWQLVREMIVRPAEVMLPGCQLSSSSSLFILPPAFMISLLFLTVIF